MISEKISKVETALRESEETARALLNATTERAALLDTEMVILAINQTWAQRIGKSVSELIGRTLDELEPSEVARTKEMFDAVIRSGKPLRFLGNRGGRILDNQLYPIFNKDGKITRVAIFCQDITDQKQAEMALHRTNEILFKEHLKRKLLSKNLINLLEEDRRHIAMELHDQIGQALTTLKMDLEMILHKLGPTEGILKTKTESAIDKAVQTIKDIKEISAGLRPSVLDNLGLVAAVSELCHNIKQKAHIKIEFFTRNVPQKIDSEKELAIYRIIQEALTNVVKHSKAKGAFVNLVKRDKVILISVEDDGVGFDIDRVTKFSKGEKSSLGLLIMEERAIQLGGKFSFESRAGAGTRLSAEIPS